MLTVSARRVGFAAVVVLLACAGKVIGCGGPPEDYLRGEAKFAYGGVSYQGCWLHEDCANMPGTFCGVFVCLCEEETEVFCAANNACVPKDECVIPGGEGGAGGAGGMPPTACMEASDCPQPPDARCGYAECKEGKCLLVITPGPTDSQKRGDCKTVYCDTAGNAKELLDNGDHYNDGRICTIDYCDAGTPTNEPLADGVKCPEVGTGVCFEGDCVDCYGSAPVNYCPNGFACDGIHCAPMSCTLNGACGIGCAPCPPFGGPCAGPDDCVEKVCVNGTCALPTCQDGVKNDGETGTDCGAPSCGDKCPDGEGCAFHGDCISGVCWAGKCQAPTCTDGVKNGEEGGIDCGAGCPLACKM